MQKISFFCNITWRWLRDCLCQLWSFFLFQKPANFLDTGQSSIECMGIVVPSPKSQQKLCALTPQCRFPRVRSRGRSYAILLYFAQRIIWKQLVIHPGDGTVYFMASLIMLHWSTLPQCRTQTTLNCTNAAGTWCKVGTAMLSSASYNGIAPCHSLDPLGACRAVQGYTGVHGCHYLLRFQLSHR